MVKPVKNGLMSVSDSLSFTLRAVATEESLIGGGRASYGACHEQWNRKGYRQAAPITSPPGHVAEPL